MNSLEAYLQLYAFLNASHLLDDDDVLKFGDINGRIELPKETLPVIEQDLKNYKLLKLILKELGITCEEKRDALGHLNKRVYINGKRIVSDLHIYNLLKEIKDEKQNS